MQQDSVIAPGMEAQYIGKYVLGVLLPARSSPVGQPPREEFRDGGNICRQLEELRRCSHHLCRPTSPAYQHLLILV